MNIQNLKEQVRETFTEVESAEFLQLQIEKGAEKHRRYFREYIALHPESTFEEWRQQVEASVNSNTTDDRMAIGIFLLALDELNHENI